MTAEERAAKLFRRIVSPRTGNFETRGPTEQEIAAAIREAVAEKKEECAQIAASYNDVYNISFCIASDIRERA